MTEALFVSPASLPEAVPVYVTVDRAEVAVNAKAVMNMTTRDHFGDFGIEVK